MAEILQHPNIGSRPNEVCFSYLDGVVRMALPEGEVLTLERVNILADRVKADIMQQLLKT